MLSQPFDKRPEERASQRPEERDAGITVLTVGLTLLIKFLKNLLFTLLGFRTTERFKILHLV